MRSTEGTLVKKYSIDIHEKCDIKTKRGRCIIPLSSAMFCLDCYSIHIQERCPNCCSGRLVKVMELFFSIQNFDETAINNKIKEFLEK